MHSTMQHFRMCMCRYIIDWRKVITLSCATCIADALVNFRPFCIFDVSMMFYWALLQLVTLVCSTVCACIAHALISL